MPAVKLNIRHTLVAVLILAAPTLVQGQSTWHVDDDAPGDPGPGDPLISDPNEDGSLVRPFDAIQEAINAAGPNDTVLVLQGTYTGTGNKDLDFGGKAITVRSASGDPTSCIIDCEGQGRGFYFHQGETQDSRVEAITITNAYADSSSPGSGNGGGIHCGNNSGPTIANCIIVGNSSLLAGAGVYTQDSSAVIWACDIVENSAGSAGGGVYCTGVSTPTFAQCRVSGNVAGGTPARGGGVYCSTDASPKFVNCTITCNAAPTGGGAFCWRSAPAFVNCTLAANTANQGAALACDSSQPLDSSDVTISNCVLWNGPAQIWNNDGSTLTVTYCDVQGGIAEPWFGEGCIDSDPMFVDPDGPDDDPNSWVDNDYRLTAGAPCIDAGDCTAVSRDVPDLDDDDCVVDRVPVDLDGNYRFYDDVKPDTGISTYWHACVDMGPYEFGSTATVPPGPCFGDLNCDGDAGFDDINPFVKALTDPTGYATEYPDCDILNADIGENGTVGFDDINGFVELVTR
jgi:hypothetical protein